MTIGSLGKVVFQVSNRTVMTLRDISIKNTASIAVHNIHLGTGLSEFTGSEPQQISFKILVSAYLGVSPETQIQRLETYLRNGTQLTFVLGDKTYGRYRWLLESFEVSVEQTDRRGNVTQCDISVTLQEYLKE